jgi:hypothetical protein
VASAAISVRRSAGSGVGVSSGTWLQLTPATSWANADSCSVLLKNGATQAAWAATWAFATPITCGAS